MRDKTVLLTPLGFATGAFVVVAGFGLHYTHVTTGQFFHTWITVALGKAFFGFITAICAKNVPGMSKFYGFANITI